MRLIFSQLSRFPIPPVLILMNACISLSVSSLISPYMDLGFIPRYFARSVILQVYVSRPLSEGFICEMSKRKILCCHSVNTSCLPFIYEGLRVFCFTIKTASEQPLTTARKLMLYLSYIAYPCTIFLLAHDPIPHSPVNKTQNPACRHRQPYCRYAYDRY